MIPGKIKAHTTDVLDLWANHGGRRRRLSRLISKLIPRDWDNYFTDRYTKDKP